MNHLGIRGLAFIELASPTPSAIEVLLVSLGFSRTHEHAEREVDLWAQNDVRVLVSREHGTHAHGFAMEHGPAVSAIGLSVENASLAQAIATRLGANGAPHGLGTSIDAPAIAGMGGSLVYFVDAAIESKLVSHREPIAVEPKRLRAIDHLTSHVEPGALERTTRFYKTICGFLEHGSSRALVSPCGTFGLRFYENARNGAGVRHIAFATDDLRVSIDTLHDLPFVRAPGVAFSSDVIGPIRVELVERGL